MLSWIFIVLAHWNNNSWVDMLHHSDTLSWFWANQSLLCSFSLILNCIVFGLTWSGTHNLLHSRLARSPLHHRCGLLWFECSWKGRFVYFVRLHWKKYITQTMFARPPFTCLLKYDIKILLIRKFNIFKIDFTLPLWIDCLVDKVLIYTFFQRGFEGESLGTVFSHAVLGNSLVAIIAGLVAQFFADRFGFV